MKRMIFILLFIIFIPSCTDWEVLAPVNGMLTVELLNVQVTFDWTYPQQIEVLNQNFGGAHVKISRRASLNEYTEIFNLWIPGDSKVSKQSYFHSGDKIELYILVNNQDGNVERWSYFQLK